MENLLSEPSYEEAKRKAKESYDKIGRVWCPVLKADILFKKPGFRHLVWKGAIQRPKSEQKRRFALLPDSMAILQNPDANVADRDEIGAHFWAFTEKRDEKIITVVVRQVGMGEKHFFSIFEDKQKSAQ